MVEEIQRQRTAFPEYEPQAIDWVNNEIRNANFPTQEAADRFDYGYGQMYNPQGGARDIGPWLEQEEYVNPNVFARQMDHTGLGSWTEGARKFAELSNEGFYPAHFESPGQARDLMNWVNSNTMMGPALDELYPEYRDLYDLDFDTMFAPQMYKSKREQIEDEENTFVANLMENYGRDNPLLQELGGMETTEVTSPRGDVTTTEEYIDDGYDLRDLGDIRYGYGSNLDPYLALPPSDLGFDRAGADPALPPSNIGLSRAGGDPALPPSNIGFARAGAPRALPPKYFGFDRAGPGSDLMDFLRHKLQRRGAV